MLRLIRSNHAARNAQLWPPSLGLHADAVDQQMRLGLPQT